MLIPYLSSGISGQILVPMILVALVFIAFIVFINIATFRNGGDVGRWAAISTIWISIPILLMGFVFLALLGGMIYLLGRLLGIAPVYTKKAQDVLQKLAARIQHIADMLAKPIITLDSVGASVKALLGRK
jgi:hypothetical protein